MTISIYRLPAELERRLQEDRTDIVQPPADGFLHAGRLNLGPAILLATSLSAGCWAILFSLGAKLVH